MIRLYLCPPLETALMVQPLANNAEGQTQSRSPECMPFVQFVQTKTSDTEWSLLQEVFDHLFARWHTPQVDVFAIRFNHKLLKIVSTVPDHKAWEVDELSLHWEELGVCAFLPVGILCQVVTTYLDHGCRRMIFIVFVLASSHLISAYPTFSAQVRQPFA